MALPQQLKSARMTNDTIGFNIDNEVGNLEKALCDILGFTEDVDVTESPLGCDNSGRLTKALLLQKAAGPVGHRFLDSDSGKEFRIAIDGTDITIDENTGTEGSPVWTNRASMAIATGVWTFTGTPVGPSADPTADDELARKAYVDAQVAASLPLTGGTLSGPLVLNDDPAADLEAATKQYVDSNAGLRGFFSKLLVRNNAVTPASKIDVSASTAIVENSSGDLKSLIDVSSTVNFGANGADGLDTGSLSNDNWYYVFVIAKADGTKACLGSLSSSSPTMPSGYTFKLLLSAVYYTGGAFRNIVQRGKMVYSMDQLSFLAITETSWTSKDMSAYIPPNATVLLAQPYANAPWTFGIAIAWDSSGAKNKLPINLYSNGVAFQSTTIAFSTIRYLLNPDSPQTVYGICDSARPGYFYLEGYELDI